MYVYHLFPQAITKDLGGEATCSQYTDRIIANLS